MKGVRMPVDLSSLTVATLKAMCKEAGLSISGRKADLIARLEEPEVEESLSLDEDIEEETISLEEDLPEPEIEVDDSIVIEAESVPLPNEVLIAEVIEAEILEYRPANIVTSSSPRTLRDQISNPKVAAVLITILLASGGWYWYVNSQLEPFTADDLRYGDTMSYTITNGDLDVTDGFIEMFQDYVDTEDEYCRLQLEFEGTGTANVAEGGLSELSREPDNEMQGAVSAKGALGLDWLAVEKSHSQTLGEDDEEFKISISNSVPIVGCVENGSKSGVLQLTTTSWTELSEQVVLATDADWSLNLGTESHKGKTVSYGVGGVLGALESIAPGVAMVFSPIEVHEVMGSSLIQEGASGTHLGWRWNVIGAEDTGWRVSLTHSEIEDYCLGHARITMWVTDESPWAVQQKVEVHISGKEGDRSQCGAATKILGDMILPEGTLDLKLDMSMISLSRGDKLVTSDMGRSYFSLPNSGAYAPSSSQLSDWGENDLHLPDRSSLRTHTLEDAVACVPFLANATAADRALDEDGYIWRAQDDRSGTATRWNLSWVSTDPNSGWVVLDVSGAPSSETCTYVNHGSHNDSPAHNRQEIPPALNISMLEEDLTNTVRFGHFHGADAFFDSTGQYHPETRVGHIVVTPDGDYTDWINQFNSGDKGATSLDLSREWESDGWDNRLTMAMDATSGQVLGWNLYQKPA
jgi:hypothetical protein